MMSKQRKYYLAFTTFPRAAAAAAAMAAAAAAAVGSHRRVHLHL